MIAMEMTREQVEIVSALVWLGIENGNRAGQKPFTPTPEQYRELCKIANMINEVKG